MKLKYGFVTTIKGGIIGIGSAIPFISLGALLASIDLFKLVIDAICNFFKDVKKNTFILVPLILGIVVGFLAGSQIMTYLYPKYNCQIVLFFVGLIMGSIPTFASDIKKNKKLFGSLLFFLIFSIFLVFCFVHNITFNINIDNLSNTIIYGVVAGIAILLPGFSEHLLNKLFGITSFTSFFGNNNFTLVYVIGVFIGLILVCFIFKYLYKKPFINYILLSLILSSVVLMVLSITSFEYSFFCIFTSLLAFLWGFLLSRKIREE